ncbi:MAG TPA: hypothetical protein VM571_09620 [Noviherbaspirillum sp.]|nr:hypothetical protein [Noviherbaspirillum sp.]
MIGLGSDGSEHNFDSGIHLRWHAGDALGFPQYGFDLYRRLHRQAEFSCIEPAKITWTASTLPPTAPGETGKTVYTASFGDVALRSTTAFTYRAGWGPDTKGAIVAASDGTLTLTAIQPWRELRISSVHHTGKVTVKAYDGATLVAQSTWPASAATVNTIIRADRFNKVTISWNGSIGFYGLCWAWLPSDERPDLTWSLIGNFRLPASWAEAGGRIASPPPHTGKDYRKAWVTMEKVVMQVPHGPKTYTDTLAAGPKPSYTVKPVEVLSLMSMVDTGLARMIGLYYIDTTAVAGELYDYMIVGRWTEPALGNERWVCYRMQVGVPPAVPVPTGLAAAAKKWIGGKSTTQTACALNWNLESASAAIASRMPVFFNVHRQKKEGAIWGADRKLTTERPVLVSSKEGALPSSFYTDGPLADGQYSYAITGVDLFGRESAKSARALITLADLIAPPPPTDVKAKLDDATKNLAVQWKWPDHRREIAGDAKEFRVYWQTEDIRPEEIHLTAVTDNGDTSDCTTDLDPSKDWSRFADGYLVNRGRKFRVTGIAVSGGKVVATIQNIAATGEREKEVPKAVSSSGYAGFLLYTPSPGDLAGRAMLMVDWSKPARWNAAYTTVAVSSAEDYASAILSLPIAVDAATPVAYALVGVGTVDATGNVGAVSVPVMVSTRKTDKPATPNAPWSEMDGGDAYATRADWYGVSRFTLGFDTLSDLYYDVMRATDAAVVYAEHGRTMTIDDVDDSELASLASTADKAFVSVGARDADGNILAGDGSTKIHEDSFPGTGRNRYVYRIAAYDKAGNRSALSDPLIVKLHDDTPPKTTRISKVKGEQNQITIRWTPGTERTLVGYELYRSTDPELATDYREMTLLKTSDTDTYTKVHASGTPYYEFTDASVTARIPYWYAVVVVKESDEGAIIRSRLSNVMTGQAYDLTIPDPPQFDTENSGWVYVDDDGTVYAADGDISLAVNPVETARIVWSHSAGATYFVQRRSQRNTSWSTLVNWSEGNVYADNLRSITDAEVNNGDLCYYRIKSKTTAGLQSEYSTSISITIGSQP